MIDGVVVKADKVERITLSLEDYDRMYPPLLKAHAERRTIIANGADETVIFVTFNKPFKSNLVVELTIYDSGGNVVTSDTITLNKLSDLMAIGECVFSTDIPDTYRFEFKLTDLGLTTVCEVEAI